MAYVIRQAEAKDSTALLSLLAATAQQGSIQLAFERAPDYFHAAAVSTQETDVWVMEDHDDGIIATFSIGHRPVYIDGEIQNVRYGSDLRIHPNFQKGRTLYRLFSQYRKLIQQSWMQTVILEENRASIESVSSGRSILPQYLPIGNFVTHMISLTKGPSKLKKTDLSHTFRQANIEDSERLQKFFHNEASKKQFFPAIDFSKIESDDAYYRGINIHDFYILEQDNEIVAMTAVWDQKSFKQTRVKGYTSIFKWLRPLYNITMQLTGGLKLPPINGESRYKTLYATVIKGNDPSIFSLLLAHLRRSLLTEDLDALACGFDHRDPLLKVALACPGHSIKSRHYIATYHPENLTDFNQDILQYPEIARL